MIKVKITDKGAQNWKRIAAALSKNYDIYVGIPNTGQRYPYKAYEYGPQRKKDAKKQSPKAPTDITTGKQVYPLVAQVAFWLEFGTADGKTPERSYLRATIIENTKKYIAMNIRVIQQVLAGNLQLIVGLRKIGLQGENDVKDAIKNFSDPPNAPSTVKRKGIDAPLKYKGTLQQSIRSFVKKR